MQLQVWALIAKLYDQHSFVDEVLSQAEKVDFGRILAKDDMYTEWSTSLQALSEYLECYHRKKCIILVDEYDAPINTAFQHQYYDDALKFFRVLFSSLLKVSVCFALLRIAKINLLLTIYDAG